MTIGHSKELVNRIRPSAGKLSRGTIAASLLTLAALAPVHAASAEAPAIANAPAPDQAGVNQSPRARGLGRFFDQSMPLLCASGQARGLPMCIRDWNPGEPDPAPILAMTLDPMYDENGRPLVAACFDPNNPPSREVMDMVEMAIGAFDRFQAQSRWSGGSFGTAGNPITLTYSFVPDGLNIPNGIGEGAAPSSLFSTMDAEFGSRAAWISLFQQCFDRWAYLTGTSYIRVTAPGVDWDDNSNWGTAGNGTTRGDVRIACKPIDGQFGVLAYNNYPNGGDMVVDAGEDWGGQTTNNEDNNFRFMRNTIMHEHGHGLGFAHTCPTVGAALMEPFLNTSFDGPRHDDLRAASNHYGDAFGSIGTTALAFNIGTLANSTTYTPTAITVGGTIVNGSLGSIDASGEIDMFKVNVPGPQQVSITVAPLGSNYATYVQDSACNNTTPNVNSLSLVNLDFDILNAGGSILLTRSAAAIGGTESFTGYILPAGDSYIRIKRNTADAFGGVQLYSLTVTSFTPPVVTATDGTDTNQVLVSWTNIPSSTGFSVFRSTTSNRASASLIGSPAAGATSYPDTTAVPGTEYFYWVEVSQGDPSKPLNVAGESGTRGVASIPTGACCVATACSTLSAADCATAGGSYLGDNAPCLGDVGNRITCCPANRDLVDGVTVNDLFLFLADWFVQNGFSGSPLSADFNGDLTVTVSDLFAFLNAWFAGCP